MPAVEEIVPKDPSMGVTLTEAPQDRGSVKTFVDGLLGSDVRKIQGKKSQDRESQASKSEEE